MYCPLPFTELRIRVNGNCYICCPQWNNHKTIGNVFDTPNLEEIWNSDSAQEVRQSMFERTFKFCNLDLCQVEKHRYVDTYESTIMEKGPRFIALNYDPSCNLYCKMCRNRKIVIPRSEQERLIEFQNNLIKSKYFKDTSMINVTSNGDPFASKVFAHLFKILTMDQFPRLKMRVPYPWAWFDAAQLETYCQRATHDPADLDFNRCRHRRDVQHHSSRRKMAIAKG